MKTTKTYGYYEFQDACEAYDRDPSQEAINAIGEWLENYDPRSWNGEVYHVEHPLLNFEQLKPVYDFHQNPVYLWVLKKLDEVEEGSEVYKFLDYEREDLMMGSDIVRYEIC